MIGLAKETGDVTRNPVSLRHMEFEQENFWTAHFGGTYIFRNLEHPAAICGVDKAALGDLPQAMQQVTLVNAPTPRAPTVPAPPVAQEAPATPRAGTGPQP